MSGAARHLLAIFCVIALSVAPPAAARAADAAGGENGVAPGGAVFDPVGAMPGMSHGTEAAAPACSVTPVTRVGMLGRIPEDIRFEEGRMAAEIGNLAEAFAIFEYLAREDDLAAGDARAQYALARMLGAGMIPPPADAVPGEAQFSRPPDHARARQLYDAAASAGIRAARRQLAIIALQGRIRADGSRAAPDPAPAGAYLDSLPAGAADHGDLLLRAEYLYRIAGKSAALAAYAEAAEAGAKPAMRVLARALCHGDGMAQDVEAAATWWVRMNRERIDDPFIWELFSCPGYEALSVVERAALRRRAIMAADAPRDGEAAP